MAFYDCVRTLVKMSFKKLTDMKSASETYNGTNIITSTYS